LLRGCLGGVRGLYWRVPRVYFVSEAAEVQLRSGRCKPLPSIHFCAEAAFPPATPVGARLSARRLEL
jgi:hypothetical protein